MPQSVNTGITETGNGQDLYLPSSGGQLFGNLLVDGNITAPIIQAGVGTFNNLLSDNTTTDNLIVNTGKIQLSNVSGTQILEAIGTNLFFDGDQLAKLSDVQDASDWATFPAIANVDINNKNISNVNNINLQTINNLSYPRPTNIFVSLDLYATINPLLQKDYGISPSTIGVYFVTAGSNLGVPGLYTVNFTSSTFPRNSSFFIKNVDTTNSIYLKYNGSFFGNGVTSPSRLFPCKTDSNGEWCVIFLDNDGIMNLY